MPSKANPSLAREPRPTTFRPSPAPLRSPPSPPLQARSTAPTTDSQTQHRRRSRGSSQTDRWVRPPCQATRNERAFRSSRRQRVAAGMGRVTRISEQTTRRRSSSSHRASSIPLRSHLSAASPRRRCHLPLHLPSAGGRAGSSSPRSRPDPLSPVRLVNSPSLLHLHQPPSPPLRKPKRQLLAKPCPLPPPESFPPAVRPPRPMISPATRPRQVRQ
jgi:hypothetical protein